MMVYTTSSDFYETSSSNLSAFFRNLINLISGFFTNFTFDSSSLIYILVSLVVVISVVLLGVKLIRSFSE